MFVRCGVGKGREKDFFFLGGMYCLDETKEEIIPSRAEMAEGR